MNKDQARKGNGQFTEDWSGKKLVPTAQDVSTTLTAPVVYTPNETVVVSNSPEKMVYISPKGEVLAQPYKDGVADGEPRPLTPLERIRFATQINLAKKATLQIDDDSLSSTEIDSAWAKYQAATERGRKERLTTLETNRAGILKILTESEAELLDVTRKTWEQTLVDKKKEASTLAHKIGNGLDLVNLLENTKSYAHLVYIIGTLEANLDSFEDQARDHIRVQLKPVYDHVATLDREIEELSAK